MCAGHTASRRTGRRYVTLDYGMDMLAALWVAVDEQGRAVVYRELYEGRDNGKGENGQGHIISAAARRLLEVNGGDEVQAWLAPPDLWNRRQDTGKSAAELFLENGVPLTKTGNSRVAGWLAVREFLALRPDEQGWNISGAAYLRHLRKPDPHAACPAARREKAGGCGK